MIPPIERDRRVVREREGGVSPIAEAGLTISEGFRGLLRLSLASNETLEPVTGEEPRVNDRRAGGRSEMELEREGPDVIDDEEEADIPRVGRVVTGEATGVSVLGDC